MRKKYTKDERFFLQTSSVLINFMLYLNIEKKLELKYTDILEFQKWVLFKAEEFNQDFKQNQNGKESI